MFSNNIKLGRIEKELKAINLYSVDLDVFSLLNLKQMEIRHSRMIAFLFNPNAEHKSKVFLIELYKYLNLEFASIKSKSISVVCEKEKKIDILIKDSFNRIIVVIENKVNSKQHDNQLQKYYKHINEKYVSKHGYRCKYVYLCKNTNEDIDKMWKQISYESLFNEIVFKHKVKCGNDSITKFIENYKHIFIREFNMTTKDNEKKKALDFYKKYKKDLDIIYDWAENEGLRNRPTYIQWIEDKLEELESKELIIYKPNLKNVDISFFSKRLDKYFQPVPKDKEWGAWRKGVAYFYWFQRINNGEDYELVFELGGVNKTNKNDSLIKNKKLLDKIKNAFKAIKVTCPNKNSGLNNKKGINKQEMGQFNQMYSYRIKGFSNLDEISFKDEIEKAIRSMIDYEKKWYDTI